MRKHNYIQFLSTQLHPLNVNNMLGESYQDLVDYFGKIPAVFEAEDGLNKIAYDKAMSSHFLRKVGDTYEVIVYTCDGTTPYVKGNYFKHHDKHYLAMIGNVQYDDYDLNSMDQLKDVI